MRFIGNKEKLLNNIYQVILSTGITGGTFCDFFAGTANVAKFLKQKGFGIFSSDLLYFSYVLQEAYIRNNHQPKFEKLLPNIKARDFVLFSSPLDSVLSYLNLLEGQEGFIYSNYTELGTKESEFQRKFFSAENGKKIDSIRHTIEEWRNGDLVSESEYYILLACLIESVPFYANISGVYAAFLKGYDPRALKPLKLRPIAICEDIDDKKHLVFNKNSLDLLENINVDILYLDPPYNARQYAPNYHLLETIAKYDNPNIKGITGMRKYDDQKSEFCNKKTALEALDRIANAANYKFLLLSYNSEGIMPQEDITKVLSKYGRTKLIEVDYRRFRSHSKGDSANIKNIREQIYLLEKV